MVTCSVLGYKQSQLQWLITFDGVNINIHFKVLKYSTNVDKCCYLACFCSNLKFLEVIKLQTWRIVEKWPTAANKPASENSCDTRQLIP